MTNQAWNFPPAPCAYCKAETTTRLGWPEPGDTDIPCCLDCFRGKRWLNGALKPPEKVALPVAPSS